MRIALPKPLIYLRDTVLDQRQVMLKSVFSPPPQDSSNVSAEKDKIDKGKEPRMRVQKERLPGRSGSVMGAVLPSFTPVPWVTYLMH